MIIFTNNTTNHFKWTMKAPFGALTIKHFSDGEIFIKIEEPIKGKDVWVLVSTQAPAENMLELFFLLDALNRAEAQVNLCITYFAYARQDRAEHGEAVSAEVISRILALFPLKRIYIVQPHSARLHNFLSFQSLDMIDFFCRHAEGYDAIAAPDMGISHIARSVAESCKKELILVKKIRPQHEQVEIESIDGQIKGKKILLVDDMIATGRTIVQAAYAFKEQGALAVAAAAVHGVFALGSRQLLEQSPLEKIWITNTIFQDGSYKIAIDDISDLLLTNMQKSL